ncbi:Sulfurtransferase [Komagataella phaffii CBS 7435]|uniref:Rhodanese domain-containing protein n=2 Tax=Komagataella phaffii TaxID=460519 RepID=C4R1H2_KOMPG|nr:uncharacterized protein PAS_chr2-1_0698 [Komagataella phaffii GS115]AOA62680.1 GQ67_00765T0 [Komagataella phaffii]CAH2448123.1 Sulfurtransferase [Komagataella phaffii CBS 7435]AOA66935.1 GQ68_00624T0 [Komagataella phaffii GS115]CAY69346.1 Putative protein of unknown function with similarity to human thiosulfate sulfurtransferase [Komagataella phaffii GS115]CCA38268.1 Sulfurtransferase [Komagataella phaffii CBS 7435]
MLKSSNLISPSQLASFFKSTNSRLVAVDASWYMPNVPDNGFLKYRQVRLGANSVFFDIDLVKDDSSHFPHMLPSVEKFNKEVSDLGITKEDTLLFYDQQGIFSAPRALWMFEIFGHDPAKLAILNTFPNYSQTIGESTFASKVQDDIPYLNTKPVTSPTPFQKSDYKSSGIDGSKIISYEELLYLVEADQIGTHFTLIDARGSSRFTGESPEPRPGLSSGHVPKAISLPFTELIASDGSYLSQSALVSQFESRKIDDSKPIIVMCGTGVTACVLRTGLQRAGLGSKGIKVYDGSWTEWAQRAPKKFIVKDI